jgi:hypothetical protein
MAVSYDGFQQLKTFQTSCLEHEIGIFLSICLKHPCYRAVGTSAYRAVAGTGLGVTTVPAVNPIFLAHVFKTDFGRQ